MSDDKTALSDSPRTYVLKGLPEERMAQDLRRLADMLESGRAKFGTGGLLIVGTEHGGIRIHGDLTLLTA